MNLINSVELSQLKLIGFTRVSCVELDALAWQRYPLEVSLSDLLLKGPRSGSVAACSLRA